MLKKNDEINITITDQSVDGLGIGKFDGFPIFVKEAFIGDRVKAGITKIKKSYGYARVIKILKPSRLRVEPKCELAAPCGGCQIQKLSYDAQLKFKTQKVLNNLTRLGEVRMDGVEFNECIGMANPWGYRNKSQIPIGRDSNGEIKAGFYVSRTHQIIPMDRCAICPPEFADVTSIVIDYIKKNDIEPYDEKTCKGTVRHILIRKAFATGEIMVCLVVTDDELPNINDLICVFQGIEGFSTFVLNVNPDNTNVILGRETHVVYGPGFIEDKIGTLKFRISAQSFFQVNPVQTEVLYNKALEYAGLTGNETVWDLYCGAGTISLFLARKAKKVYGVEIVGAAIENARENARLNHIDNAEFFCGKAEELAPDMAQKLEYKPDVVVVDPPRKGCDKACLDAIATMEPKRIVYVSCDSATLARDVKYLGVNGYELTRVQPVDMFPQTVHVESVVLITRKEK